VDSVLKAISRYSMLASGARVAVAVSGGRDSVCLLHVLRELAGPVGFCVAGVAHLNHQLRGAASDEDEHFVAALAARLGLPFWSERAAVGSEGGNLEEAARRARHRFFFRLIREGRADRVATGHTSSDQAETVLFRLLRGSGLSGLAGILPVTREGLIRPLIGVSREETGAYLRERGIPWREDASNADPRFARNRIRHDLLPSLERDWNPSIAAALANLGDLAAEEERWREPEIGRLARELLVADAGGVDLNATLLAALPRAAARRLVREAVRRVAPGGLGSFDQIERILDLAAQPRGHGGLELPGVTVRRSFDWMRLAQPDKAKAPSAIRVQVPGRYPWAEGLVCLDHGPSACAQSGCARLKLTAGSIPAPLELRGWIAGDRYRSAGRFRDQKVKELFEKTRVPSWRRRSWPMVTSGPIILWMRGFGAAAEFVAEDQPETGNESDSVLHIWEEKTPDLNPQPSFQRL
jgi:tRNA(Ile)-lysidine synthase